MILLGNLVLSDDLICTTDYAHQSHVAVTDMAVDGTEISFIQRRSSGRKIDLEAGDNYAWLTREQVDALYAMSEAGGEYLLTWRGQQMMVRFRYEDGALDLQPVIPRPDYIDQDYFRGKIRLKEV
ncbi:MAG: hypothetical protein PHC35_01655 [Deltaproteobacteria bacterium]|nr:hypothetical protein [Deltaproteobacteria bacterium]